MIRTLFLRNLRQHLPLLGVISLGLFLFELAVVWVAARLDMGPEFRQFLQTFLPPDFVELTFSQFGFGSFAGTEVTVDGEEYLLMSETDILAIIG